MKLIVELHTQDFEPDAPIIDPTNYHYRQASRAVVFDGQRVALVYVGTQHYYKLPGGGIDPGETKLVALRREIREEIGRQISDIQELGETLEYKDYKQQKQRSYCFLAKAVGKPLPPAFTDDEIASELQIVWADDLAAAVRLVRDTPPGTISGKFHQRRDLCTLEAAERLH
jgi:8-oxo-dGTP diphosphatase